MSEDQTEFEQNDYWPVIEVNEVKYELLSIHLCIDFGGRQAVCEFQNVPLGRQKSGTYYWLTNTWSDNAFPTDDKLTQAIKNLFDQFDVLNPHQRRECIAEEQRKASYV